jgi:hypothetical protein
MRDAQSAEVRREERRTGWKPVLQRRRPRFKTGTWGNRARKSRLRAGEGREGTEKICGRTAPQEERSVAKNATQDDHPCRVVTWRTRAKKRTADPRQDGQASPPSAIGAAGFGMTAARGCGRWSTKPGAPANPLHEEPVEAGITRRSYSLRSVSMGSMRAARRAGM